MSDLNNKDSLFTRFRRATAGMLRSIAHKLDPNLSLSASMQNNVQQPEVGSPTDSTPVEIIFAKEQILKELNFNFGVSENKNVLEKGESVHKILNDLVSSNEIYRERIIEAQDKESLLSIVTDLEKSNRNIYNRFKNTQEDGVDNTLTKAFARKYFSLGGENPTKIVDDNIEMFGIRQKSGFNERTNYKPNNNKSYLATVGKQVQLEPIFKDLQKRITEFSDRFGVSFVELEPGCGKKSVKILTEMIKSSEDFSKRIGITEDCVGLKGRIGYKIQESSAAYGGYSNSSKMYICVKSGSPSLLAHEWMHSLDGLVMTKAREHMKEHYGVELPGYHVSTSNNSLPVDGSKELYAYKVLRDYTANILSADKDKLDEIKFKKEQDIAKHFMQEALGNEYFSIPADKRNNLVDETGMMLIKAKMMLPKYETASLNLLIHCKDVLGDGVLSPEAENRLNDFIHSEDNPFFNTAARRYNEAGDYYAAGMSNIVKRSNKADEFKNDKLNILSSNFSLMTKREQVGQDLFGSKYFGSETEILSRNLEAHLYPKTAMWENASDSRGVQVYSRLSEVSKKETNERFNKSLDDLIVAALGKESLRKREIPDVGFSDKFAAGFAGVSMEFVINKPAAAMTALLHTVDKVSKMTENAVEFVKSKVNGSSNEPENNISINKESIKENHQTVTTAQSSKLKI